MGTRDLAGQPPHAPPMPSGVPAVGEVIADKYRVERVLGAGGMGVVVAARQLSLDTRVAIKFLLPGTLQNPDAVARFTREAHAAVRITNEHVARVLDVGRLANESPYIVMEFLEGEDLSSRLKAAGRLSIEEAVEDVLQACEALSEAHGLGIVHRDLKPANLFCIRRPDGLPWIKVLDFGISKLLSTDPTSSQGGMTQSAVVMGSPMYMSPEQMRSARYVDARSDIWAIGIVLFELLAGRPPFGGESFVEVVLQASTWPTPSLRALRGDCPEPLEQVVFRCLEKDRDRRFVDVAALAVALLPFAPERARGSVERIARAAHRTSGLPPSAEVASYVPSQAIAHGGAPASPAAQTLDALGRTAAPQKRSTGPLLWVAATIGTVALVLVAGAARLVVKPKAEPASVPAPAAAAPSTHPEASELLPPPSQAPKASPPAVPAVEDSARTTTTPSASAPRSPTPPPQTRPSASPVTNQRPAPQRPASSTPQPQHEDIY